MHILKLKFPQLLVSNWEIYTNEDFGEIYTKIDEANLPFAQDIKHILISHIYKYNNLFRDTIPILNKQLVLSHIDVHSNNVLWNQDNSCLLIDWEAAKLINPMQENLIPRLNRVAWIVVILI